MKNAGVLLAGGGLDSTALMIWLAKQKYQIQVMHVNYGQKAFYPERLAVDYFADKYGFKRKGINCDLSQIASAAILTNAPMATEHVDNRLEGRNVVLVGLALTYAATEDLDRVFVGYHKEPSERPFPDATEEALMAMNAVASLAYGKKMTVEAPLYKMTRLEIFKMGRGYDMDFERRSHTCYEATVGGCGKCTHCKQQREMVKLCAA